MGMTFWMAFTEHLPTLLLVSMGASEAHVGLQGAFLPGLQLLQLPTLRAIARVSKRSILVAGQLFALAAALPLLFLETIEPSTSSWAVISVLLCFAAVAAGLQVGNTVWFPLLRSYVEPGQVGRFFGLLRSGWHLALMIYYAGAQLWLAHSPGRFAPLFGVAWILGMLRCGLVMRMPERSERTQEKIRVREALALVRDDPSLRSLLIGSASNAAIRGAVLPFAIVMMRREIGFSEAQVLLCTFVYYAGGLASLYLWGRISDRIGPAPVFLATTLGLAALLMLISFVDTADARGIAMIVIFFAGRAIFTSGFGVAETQALFDLTPSDTPARTLVIAGVLTSSMNALAPLLAGLLLQQALTNTEAPLAVYRIFFGLAAVAQLLVFWPLRRVWRSERPAGGA